MPTSLYNFQYVPLTGRLPGKSFVSQTEQAINGLAQYVYENSTNYEAVKAIAQKAEEDSSSALEYSEQALDKAQTALETVGRAYIKTTSAVDLDDYFDSELLLILSTESTNIPASISGYLTVMSSDTHDYCMQVYIGIDGSVYKRTATISNDVPTFGAWSETPITMSSLQTILADYAKANASNVGVNAQTDNSIAWGNAIGGGEIANGEQRLITGGTVYPLSQNVEQNTSNIATNTADIVQNTGGISANSKRIGNIEKLLQGNLYDYDTDDDTAYTKTVPSGAMPYAGLESLGGKTVVWNQLYGRTSNHSGKGVSVSIVNGYATFSGEANESGNAFSITWNDFKAVAGHKYLWRTTIQLPTGCWFSDPYNDSSNNSIIDKIFTASVAFAVLQLLIGDSAVGADFTNVKGYLMFYDLTLMFGAGNEPSTVAEFEAMFPANVYTYSAPTLLSAGVTEVKSDSKNLADYRGGVGQPSDTTSAVTTKRIFPVGKIIKGIAFNNAYNEATINNLTYTDNSISFYETSGYSLGIAFNCVGNTTYAFSITHAGGSNYRYNICVSWYSSDGTYIGVVELGAISGTAKAPSNATQGVLLLGKYAPSYAFTYSDIQIELGSTVTTYAPPTGLHETYPIPTAIRNLEGYGWSAGTAYNYVDFERKVFVQNVGKIDNIGAIEYYARDESETMDQYKTAIFRNIIKINYDAPNMVTDAPYTAHGWGGQGAGNFVMDGAGTVFFYTPHGAFASIDAFKASVNGKALYYELKTPVETDISEYLTDDNLIEVEAGGTITFPNSNGTDYQIPVPSEETYMIDLQSAIGG